jgi:hypothetical protein
MVMTCVRARWLDRDHTQAIQTRRLGSSGERFQRHLSASADLVHLLLCVICLSYHISPSLETASSSFVRKIGFSRGAMSDATYNTISSSIHSIPCAPRVGIGKYCPFLILPPLFFGLGTAESCPILFRVPGELL